MNRVILGLLLSLTFGGLFYTRDLNQKNTETIFLTSSSQISYQQFKEKFKEKKIVVFKKKFNKDFPQEDEGKFIEYLKTLEEQCDGNCHLLTHLSLPKSAQTLFQFKSPDYTGFLFSDESDDGQHVKNIIKTLRGSKIWNNDSSLEFAGTSYTNLLLDEYALSIKQTLFPLLFISIFILLVLFTGSLKAAILNFIPCLLAASLSLSLTKLFYHQSNLVSSIVPLLMFVINLSLVLHVYFTAMELGSIRAAIEEKKKPLFLMITTTFVGFFSLYFTELSAIQNFGLLTAFLIVITSFTSLAWLFFSEKEVNYKQQKKYTYKFLIPYFSSFLSSKAIGILAFISLIFGLYLTREIPIITDATQYFPTSSGLKQSIDDVSRTVIGTPITNIIIQTKETLDFSELLKLDKIENQLQDKLKNTFPDLKFLSSNILVKLANMSYTGNNIIPNIKISYLSLRSQLPSFLKESFSMTPQYRISVLSPPLNVDQYEKILTIIKTVLDQHSFQYEFNGLYHHLMIAQKRMISTLFKSFFLSLFIISLLTFIFFKSAKLFFIFIFVNTIPVFLSFLFLKIFGISFNIATVMTYSISLGIIVDSSFHIICTLDKNTTYNFYFNSIVLPVFGGSLLLASCFFMFGFNPFIPIQEFGITLGIILLIGTFFDLKILPRLYTGQKSLN
ncbi:MAG: hypothetical protein H6621_10705 [Halobacteriovoraceae bacterium]|nr:hypothetical protein [Halobacteriovoraceae bacterium]MCB9095527.1 hypothetical protein [Halobacteriovoraceae bacterium]